MICPLEIWTRDKSIDKAQANLPLPEQPPRASDWQSMDARNVNLSAGKPVGNPSDDSHSNTGLQGPASTSSASDKDLSNVGREGKDNLKGPPKDASA
ncbi:hypothetical protein jhhlp_006429 [Lomentospora prolificans]|uniref:Uncharacterized protein n=1 Tax=Lomentospora prolificans TaxID=41688 RepID=A0A2N3N5V8_9PEZI|nr:hypothetical protein jhhlp_006429 [Lomentospora prolificans]